MTRLISIVLGRDPQRANVARFAAARAALARAVVSAGNTPPKEAPR